MKTVVTGAAALFDHIFPVKELPSRGRVSEILMAPSVFGRTYFGGTAFNIAVTLARLKVGCSVIHAVGEDFPGSSYERWLMGQGVSQAGIRVVPEERSGHAFLFYEPGGETLCFSYPGAASCPLDLGGVSSLLAEADMVVIAPVFGSLAVQALDFARQYQIPVAACGIPSPGLIPFLSRLEVIIANEDEVGFICHSAGVSGPRGLVGRGVKFLFETHGAQGSELFTAEDREMIPAVSPQEFVDPTGTGDGYAGGVLAGLAYGLEPRVAALVGSVVASFVLEKVGCQTNLPDWGQVRRRFEEHFPELSFHLPSEV